MRIHTPLFLVVSLIVFVSCARSGVHPSSRPATTCVVLSSGGMKSLYAELGALEELAKSEVTVDCVIASGVGVLAGGLYAKSPQELEASMEAIVDKYSAKTRSSVLFGLIMGFGGLFNGNPGVLELASAATYEPKPTFDYKRTVRTLEETLGDVRVEDLRLSLVALHLELGSESSELKEVRTGRLSDVIAKSLATPYLFQALPGDTLDAGMDPALRTPVTEACRLFPGARLIAVRFGKAPPLPKADCRVLDVSIADPLANSRGWIGVDLRETGNNVSVRRVVSGSPADRAGIREGDDIESINGKKMRDDDVAERMIALHPNQEIEFVISRPRDRDRRVVVISEGRVAYLDGGADFERNADLVLAAGREGVRSLHLGR